jgi:hypothetical protein
MLHLALRFVAGAVTRDNTSASRAGSKVPPPMEPGVGAGVAPALIIHIAVSLDAEVAPNSSISGAASHPRSHPGLRAGGRRGRGRGRCVAVPAPDTVPAAVGLGAPATRLPSGRWPRSPRRSRRSSLPWTVRCGIRRPNVEPFRPDGEATPPTRPSDHGRRDRRAGARAAGAVRPRPANPAIGRVPAGGAEAVAAGIVARRPRGFARAERWGVPRRGRSQAWRRWVGRAGDGTGSTVIGRLVHGERGQW